MALGLVIGRRVRNSADFLVAGRRLGPGLIFSTMLAANIGAGDRRSAPRRKATCRAWPPGGGLDRRRSDPRSSLSGSVLRCAAWRRNTICAQRRRLSRISLQRASVRAIISVMLWIGTTFILASQLILASPPRSCMSSPEFRSRSDMCRSAGIVVTVYFIAGGLLTSARVNVVQLVVKLAGFALARLPADSWRCRQLERTRTRAKRRTMRRMLDVLARGYRGGLPVCVCAGGFQSSHRGFCRKCSAPATITRCASASD